MPVKSGILKNIFVCFRAKDQTDGLKLEMVLDQKAYLEELNRSLRYVKATPCRSIILTKQDALSSI